MAPRPRPSRGPFFRRLACAVLLAAVALAAQGRRAAAGEAAPAAPTITSFSPTSGKFPDLVTITGTGFSGATQVTIGGVPSAKITVVSTTQITALVRSIAADTGPITVTTMRGTATSAGVFAVTKRC